MVSQSDFKLRKPNVGKNGPIMSALWWRMEQYHWPKICAFSFSQFLKLSFIKALFFLEAKPSYFLCREFRFFLVLNTARKIKLCFEIREFNRNEHSQHGNQLPLRRLQVSGSIPYPTTLSPEIRGRGYLQTGFCTPPRYQPKLFLIPAQTFPGIFTS